MALLNVNFFSKALGMCTSMNVILPEKEMETGAFHEGGFKIDPEMIDPHQAKVDVWDGESPLSVLYLLHGASDDHTIWCRRTSIERYVTGKKLAVIMPAVAISFYSDEANGYPYWQFISEELPQVVKAFFKISDKREDTYVAGLSMGSFGAAKLALDHPDRYCKAALFSGGIYMGQLIAMVDDLSRRILGDPANLANSSNDLPALARALASSGKEKPEFFTACGKKDFLYPLHQQMVSELTELGFTLTSYEEEDAYHEWPFWDKTIQIALDWMKIC